MIGRLAVFGLVAGSLLVAFAVDRLWGDPREGSFGERWYPPVVVGRAAGAFERRVARGDPTHERWWGAAGFVLLVAIVTALAVSLAWLVGATLPGEGPTGNLGWAIAGVVALGFSVYWLKSTFAVRTLEWFCSRPIGKPIEEMRRDVGVVVNRPTADLSDRLLYSALIESAVENTTDSIVSPLLAYSLLGLPGAVAYRAINTLDALWGHREPRWRHFGEVTARVDSAVNRLPDALASALLRLVALRSFEPPSVERIDPSAKIPSTIRTAAGLLKVRLERRGSYILGASRPFPGPEDVRATVIWVRRASMVMLLIGLGVVAGLVDVGWTYFLR